MLSMFPELLFLAPLSALVIRASVAALFALSAYMRVRGEASTFIYIMAALETLAALSLAIGYKSQLVAFLGVLLIGVWIFMGRPVRQYPLSTALLAAVMSLSLLVTGPGAFAFDLPL